MTSPFGSGFNNFVPNDLIIPRDTEEFEVVLTDYIRYVINALDTREISIYDEQEFSNGNIWFNPANRQQPRYGLRRVVDFGALPNAAQKTVAHGITTTSTTIFTRIYATATDPGASTITRAIPIPYINTTTPGDSVELDVDATNVRITTTTANYTAFTQCYVVLEYLQA